MSKKMKPTIPIKKLPSIVKKHGSEAVSGPLPQAAPILGKVRSSKINSFGTDHAHRPPTINTSSHPKDLGLKQAPGVDIQKILPKIGSFIRIGIFILIFFGSGITSLVGNISDQETPEISSPSQDLTTPIALPIRTAKTDCFDISSERIEISSTAEVCFVSTQDFTVSTAAKSNTQNPSYPFYIDEFSDKYQTWFEGSHDGLDYVALLLKPEYANRSDSPNSTMEIIFDVRQNNYSDWTQRGRSADVVSVTFTTQNIDKAEAQRIIESIDFK